MVNTIRFVVWIVKCAGTTNVRELVVINVSEVGDEMDESVSRMSK